MAGIELRPLEADDSEQFIKDNQEAFLFGAVEEFGVRDEHFEEDGQIVVLDYKTDRALRSRLKKETADVTTLIVAQRVGTIRDADKILVLDEGRIVGMGTHEQLLRDCEVYKEIARTQLSEEELA